MSQQVLELLDPGLGASLQDQGRVGWRRFGVPTSGVMDEHAANWGNLLLENPLASPVLELLLQGAKLAVIRDTWIAITGADAEVNLPMWQAVRVSAGQQIHFGHNRVGCWSYLAVEGGFDETPLLGSVSAYPRGHLGKTATAGDILRRRTAKSFQLPPGVAGRRVPWTELRHYEAPPPLRIWPGPQWDLFDEEQRGVFFAQKWTVTSQCDRVGYRLAGEPLKSSQKQILSEPVRVGTVQIPENGQPLVIMRDGPTVGGYPKIGMVDPADLSWLTQCRPGQSVRFQRADAT